jgi:hypothetical protein
MTLYKINVLILGWDTGGTVILHTNEGLPSLPLCVWVCSHWARERNANGKTNIVSTPDHYKRLNSCTAVLISGCIRLYESVSVHHLPRGSTASGLQSLQDNGTQAPTCPERARNCECKLIPSIVSMSLLLLLILGGGHHHSTWLNSWKAARKTKPEES